MLIALVKNEIEKKYNRGADFVEGIVLSVNPLTVSVNGLKLDKEWMKKLRGTTLQINDTVLLGKKLNGQMYYILGVID